MKKPLIHLFLILISVGAVFGLSSSKVFAGAGNICFCHSTGSKENPFGSVCTSQQGQQEGHTNHGDPDFGCFCGDGTCDAGDGEDQYTCPQDCGTPPTCGDGTVDLGEECGETGTFCTVAGETCIGCRCAPPPPDCFVDDDCSDSDACNGDETCAQDRNCLPGTDLTCDDGEICNGTESCDPASGCQAGTPVSCDDQRTCSVDSCDSQNGLCQFDVSVCSCDVDIDCDDGNPCTDDVCNFPAGTCSNTTNDQNSCDDSNACTQNDQCSDGTCLGQALNCDDGLPCTDDSCDPASGCQFDNDDTNECADGDVCNGTESCQAGECVDGTPAVCDDDRSCSADSCDSQTGLCQFDVSQCSCESDADCDDGNPCNTDHCNIDTGACENSQEQCEIPEDIPAAINPGGPNTFDTNGLSGSGQNCSLQKGPTPMGSSSLFFLLGLGLFGLLRFRDTSSRRS